MYDNLKIGFSPLTGKVYLGKTLKSDPNMWSEGKRDITNNFLQVVLNKFEPGTETGITDGKKQYFITVREVEKG